jgi:hypothetical protein
VFVPADPESPSATTIGSAQALSIALPQVPDAQATNSRELFGTYQFAAQAPAHSGTTIPSPPLVWVVTFFNISVPVAGPSMPPDYAGGRPIPATEQNVIIDAKTGTVLQLVSYK